MILNNLKEFFQRLFNGGGVSDLYARKSRWKFALAIVGMVIIVASTIYTNYLVGELRKQEEKRMDLFRRSIEIFSTVADFNDLPESVKSVISSISIDSTNIPMIWTDDHYNIQDIRNFDDSIDSTGYQVARDSAFAKRQLDALITANRKPIIAYYEDGLIAGKIYYDDSKILKLLRYYPLFQFILIELLVFQRHQRTKPVNLNRLGFC